MVFIQILSYLKINNTILNINYDIQNIHHANPFHDIGRFLYPPGNLWFSDVFRRYRKRLTA